MLLRKSGKSTCSKLMVDGELVSDYTLCWMFGQARSRVDKSEELQDLLAQMDFLASKSKEAAPDVSFTTKDIVDAVKKLNSRKAVGPNG